MLSGGFYDIFQYIVVRKKQVSSRGKYLSFKKVEINQTLYIIIYLYYIPLRF